MKRSFFNPEDGLWRTVMAVANVMILSVLWAICSLPIFTLGPATSALYVGVKNHVRPMEDGAIRTFFVSFKENFTKGAIMGTMEILFFLALCWATWIIYQMATFGNGLAEVLYYCALMIIFFIIGIISYSFPTLGRFEYGVIDCLKMSMTLGILHLPSTIILAAIVILSAYSVYLVWLMVVFVPALAALFSSFILERIYERHTD